MEKIGINPALATFFIALAVVLIGGLIAVPVLMEAAEARTCEACEPTNESRNKGQQGDLKSEGKRKGGINL